MCTGSYLQGPAGEGRCVWYQSPPDSAPEGWKRSGQTEPAAAEERERKQDNSSNSSVAKGGSVCANGRPQIHTTMY